MGKAAAVHFSDVFKDTSLDEFIERYYPRLMGYATTMVSHDEALDIVQDVFLYIWEHRDRIEVPDGNESGLRSYLYSACHSRMLNYVKRHGRLDLMAPEALKRAIEDQIWLSGNRQEIIESLGRDEIISQISATMETLLPARQKVFSLSFFYGMSNADIAEYLDIPKRTVESHLYLALRLIRSKVHYSL